MILIIVWFSPFRCKPDIYDGFRKPIWYDDESDDELFDNHKSFKHFHVFTNPMEMQKHFEQQMQEIMKTVDQFNGKYESIER